MKRSIISWIISMGHLLLIGGQQYRTLQDKCLNKRQSPNKTQRANKGVMQTDCTKLKIKIIFMLGVVARSL